MANRYFDDHLAFLPERQDKGVATGDYLRVTSTLAAVGIGSVLLLPGEPNPVSQQEVKAERVDISINDNNCDIADRGILVTTPHGQRAVKVRLDCVDPSKVSDEGATILVSYGKGIVAFDRASDNKVMEAVCRHRFNEDNSMNDEYQGETEEWVQLYSAPIASTLDNMPLVDMEPTRTEYVNGGYVVGEKTLPECKTAI